MRGPEGTGAREGCRVLGLQQAQGWGLLFPVPAPGLTFHSET